MVLNLLRKVCMINFCVFMVTVILNHNKYDMIVMHEMLLTMSLIWSNWLFLVKINGWSIVILNTYTAFQLVDIHAFNILF